MPQREQTYTYRGGEKVPLEKSTNQFVVRALPERLKDVGIADAETVSPASSRVTVRSADLEAMMNRSRAIAPTHHAYYIAGTEEEFLITDRILVSFRTPMPDADVDAFANRYNLVLKEKFGDRDYLFQLTDHTGMNPVKLVVKLTEQEPQVQSAEHDLNHRLSKYQFFVPSDPAYAREWHLHTRFNNAQFDPRSSSQVEAAWQLLDHFGSLSVVVGISDDGCKLDHSDFDSGSKFAGWGYFRGSRLVTNADIDALPSEMYQAGSNHGTSCAGVIAGEVDAALTVGAAPGCRLLPIQWESTGAFLSISDSKLLTALNFIADKVDVLSNSWGGVPTSIWAQQVINRIAELAQTGGRRGKGILFLWAAGNDNCPIQHTASVDVPYDHGWRLNPNGPPTWVGVSRTRVFRNNLVGVPGVMHVAALCSVAQRSHYSNYGTGIHVCAPTNNGHEYFRLTVPGLGITTTTGPGTSGVTNSFGGTSSATPLVAGIAALVISANPDLTALEVASILKQTAAKDLSLEGYPRTPPASFNTDVSWDVSPVAPFDRGDFQNVGDPDGTWSPWFGHGRVDAARAVAEATRRKMTPTAETLRKTSMPEVGIPDNNATGVRDTINFTETATVASIKVNVNISHTFIGDLKVTLIAPSGTQVVLHNRNGGGAQNLQTTFSPMSTPALTALSGQSLKGNWVLFVQDLAARDAGRLNRWEIEAQAAGVSSVSVEESPAATIPDNDPNGIERTLSVNESGTLKEVAVALDITHTYIGDLSVKLVSPGGTEVSLHERSGGSADNLIRTFTPADVPGLTSLRGMPIQGAWKIRIADLEAVDVGKLNRWGLKVIKQP